MNKDMQKKIYDFSSRIEIFISIILGIAILALALRMLSDVFQVTILGKGIAETTLNYLLEKAMNLAIGVELIKMLCKHTPETVIEVLLFAIARQLVVEHASGITTLVGVVSIAALFATRKYLFCATDSPD